MEKHKIDSLIKNAVNESDNFYDSDAINARERIWNHIQPQKQVKPLFPWLLAAASILLFVGLSVVTFYNIKYKSTINTLVESNTLLKNDLSISKQNLLTKKETLATAYRQTTDTVYIEKKIVEYKALVTTQRITDTVYVKQIVYVEKEQDANLIAVNENSSSSDSSSKTIEDNYQSDIIISSNDAIEKKKSKKMRIKFGGNRTQIKEGTLAFRTNP